MASDRIGVGDHRASSSMSLLLLARGGDEAAINELCVRYLPRLRRFAHGRLPVWARGHLDTEDLVQDTLLHSVRQLDHFTPEHEHAFHGYVCQALRNRLRDAVRTAKRRPSGNPIDEEAQSSAPSPLELAVGQQALERYEAALTRIAPLDRELIVARIELGLSYPEIVDVLGKPSLGAARVAVSRALVRLARAMQDDGRAVTDERSAAANPEAVPSSRRPRPVE